MRNLLLAFYVKVAAHKRDLSKEVPLNMVNLLSTNRTTLRSVLADKLSKGHKRTLW